MKEIYFEGRTYSLTVWEDGFIPGNEEERTRDVFGYKVSGTINDEEVNFNVYLTQQGILGGDTPLGEKARPATKLVQTIDSVVNHGLQSLQK